MAFDPNKALAIIFGASQWPNLKHLNSSSKVNPFQAAAQGMRDYFVNSLQLPADNVLFDDLFDSSDSPTDIVRTINGFLDEKLSKIKPIDLFIYFVGHGGVLKTSFYLCVKSTGEEEPSWFLVRYLTNAVINRIATNLRRCYIIIDACFSAAALDDLSTIDKKISSMLLVSSNRNDSSKGAQEEITKFTGALLTVLKQPQEGNLSFSEVHSLIREHIKTPTPEIHNINQGGGMASDEKILRSYSAEHSSNPTPNPVLVKKGRVIVNKKLKWAIGIVLLGAVGIAGKVGYDSLFPLSPDHLLLQQLQASLQPQLGEQFSVSSTHYQENNRQRVVELSLAGLGLSTVPEVVWQFKQLRKLNLYNNHLETLPDAVGNLELLNELNLEKNRLQELPVSVGKLQLLERLDLQSNLLKELPAEVTAIGLGLKWQPQNELEKGIFLADNPLVVPPPEKVKKGMERVELVEYFQRYPRDIRDLERVIGKRLPLLEKDSQERMGYGLDENNQVVELRLKDMGLTEIPKEVWRLQQLQWLGLVNNKLTTLPKEIENLKQLQLLDLYGNQLTALPPQIGQLQQLVNLAFGNNQLTNLPPEIGNLKGLRYLFSTSCQLKELPPEIGKLQLYQLVLSGNQLTQLPKEIGNLEELYRLNLSNNQLFQLPKEIGNLKKLDHLDLSDNRLTELPPEILSLNLELKFEKPKEWGSKGIFLVGNPLQVPPPEVIQQGREAVVKYFQERGK